MTYILMMFLTFYLQSVACAFGKNYFVKLLPVFAIILAYLGYLIDGWYAYGSNSDGMIWKIAMIIYYGGIPLADILAWGVYGLIHIAQNKRK